MNKLLMSVAMCTFNGEQYLKEQLDSINSQIFLPYELIICDDGSTDRTMQLVSDFSFRAKFKVQVFSNEVNLRSTKNFEKAIGLCNGDVIVLADQDDIWREDKLTLICEEFLKNQEVGLVFSNGHIVNYEGLQLGGSLWDSFRFTSIEQKRIESGEAFDVLLGHSIVTGATMAFRTKFVDLICPIPVDWVHDGWISLLISTVAKIKPINIPLISYRKHSSQQIGVGNKKGMISKLKNVNCSDDFLIYIKQSQLLKQKLLSLPATSSSQRHVNLIDDRLSHLKVRVGTISLNYLKRMPLILRELLILRRYHKYSNGVGSFVKDIFK